MIFFISQCFKMNYMVDQIYRTKGLGFLSLILVVFLILNLQLMIHLSNTFNYHIIIYTYVSNIITILLIIV